MRLIYMDEAGTSAREPTCVVAGVIVNGDDEYHLLTRELRSLVDQMVPEALRKDFNVHATEIFSGGKTINRDAWPFDDRLDFLKAVVSLPFVHDIPIAFAIVNKVTAAKTVAAPEKLSDSDFAHLMAFAYAVSIADLFLKKYLLKRESGVVVAEDHPTMRRFLQAAGLLFRENPLTLDKSYTRRDRVSELLNLPATDIEYTAECIIDVPHFVTKKCAPLLQLADACAFSIRHCITRKREGDNLVLAMLGPVAGHDFVTDPIWFTGPHSALYNTEKYHSVEQREAKRREAEEFALRQVLSAWVTREE